jgi:antitoxin ParD1/3/4
MTRLSISLPESLRRFVDEQVAAGPFGTASEYIRALIQEAQQREAEQERLEALLIEGLDSGPGIEVTPEFWRELRAELEERYRCSTTQGGLF